MKLRHLLNELELNKIIPSKLPAGTGSPNDKINQQLAAMDKDTARIQAQATANRKKTYTTPASKSYNDQMADLDGEEKAALDKLSKTSAGPLIGNKLFEAHHKATASFCFGRFNPPHQGHAEVWSAVKHAGHKWYIGTNPSTIGPNDPLTFDVKTAWMTAIDPEIKGHILGETSVVTLAAKIYADVGEGATIAYVTDATDWAWAGKLLMDYNGKESNHGYYKFAKIIHVPSPRVSSATALRTAARAGDMAAFYAAAGTDPDLRVNGKHYFDTVVAAVGEHPEKVKRAKKEKATAEDAAGVGTITKQNTTVDVNKNTPAKNLRAFNLIKETNARIRAMRAKEFIAEEATAFSVDVQNALPNVRIHPDLDNSSPYKAYRYGIAMAGAPNNQGDPLAGIGQKMITVGYTDADDAIIASADKFMSSKSKPITSKGSQELKDTNKTSPVAKVKRNKYGV